MALPTSGQLSVGDIYTEIYGLTPQQTGGSASLSNMAYQAGFTPPQAVSDFYGYSSYYPTWANVLGGSISYSAEGYQNYSISCYNRQDGAASWDLGSSWGGTYNNLTSVAPTTFQDYDGSTPDSFVVNDDGQNRLYISRTLTPYNAATITVNLTAPSNGTFSQVSYSTYNGVVTTFSSSSTNIYIVMNTSGGSLSSHTLEVFFDL